MRLIEEFNENDPEVVNMLMHQLEKELEVDPLEKIEHPPVALSMGEHRMGEEMYPSPIVTYGNLIFIQAPPKSMKTYLTNLLVSAYLSGGGKPELGQMKGFREGRRVFHFDTEQSKFHAQKVFNRTLRITGEDSSKYHTYALRKLGPKDRTEFIKYCLYNKFNAEEVGLVVIDGIADLINDVNNIEESNDIVQQVMKWSQELNCAIICVIHQNYGTEKATGHLGSALLKKAETALFVKKEGTMATVECRNNRNFPFDDFSFKVNRVGLPEIIDTQINVLKDRKYKNVV
jgi:hypothetical protein